MVWGAISFNGKLDLNGIEEKMDTIYYTQILETALLLIAKIFVGEGWILQQGNGAVHTSRHTNDFLDSHDIATSGWPAKLPDLNLIANGWCCLARGVYQNERQFQNAPARKEAIMNEWNSIKTNIFSTGTSLFHLIGCCHSK